MPGYPDWQAPGLTQQPAGSPTVGYPDWEPPGMVNAAGGGGLKGQLGVYENGGSGLLGEKEKTRFWEVTPSATALTICVITFKLLLQKNEAGSSEGIINVKPSGGSFSFVGKAEYKNPLSEGAEHELGIPISLLVPAAGIVGITLVAPETPGGGTSWELKKATLT